MLTDNLVEIYREAGMDLYSGYVAERIEERDGQYTVFFWKWSNTDGDCVLFAGGRVPNTQHLGLEKYRCL